MAIVVVSDTLTEVPIQSAYDWDCPSTGVVRMDITLKNGEGTFSIKREYSPQPMTNSFNIDQYLDNVEKVEMFQDTGEDITLLGS